MSWRSYVDAGKWLFPSISIHFAFSTLFCFCFVFRIWHNRCIVMFSISKVIFTHVTYLFELFFNLSSSNNTTRNYNKFQISVWYSIFHYNVTLFIVFFIINVNFDWPIGQFRFLVTIWKKIWSRAYTNINFCSFQPIARLIFSIVFICMFISI